MPKPSLFRQVDAVNIDPKCLMKSPRHWNAGLLEYDGGLWLAYRYHRNTPDSRCGIALCEIDRKTLRAKPGSQHLDLDDGEEGSHHEDPRLFMFQGHPHISYTEMSNYQPGVDYACCMKYARLTLKKGRWKAAEIFHPNYGHNSGTSREKNWVFFESAGKLHCVYQDAPDRIVLRLEGAEVVEEWGHSAPVWSWGPVRGGTPPVPHGDELIAFFHSSMATEHVPHHVRYYAGAYTMEKVAPFRVTAISERPLMTGSESDGHRVDPRYTAGWKPFVVFPCGCVPEKNRFLVSLGVNDWCVAIAKIKSEQLHLGPADGSAFTDRFFRTANGSFGVRISDDSGKMNLVEWLVPRQGLVGMAGQGYLRVSNPRNAEELLAERGVTEIPPAEYEAITRVRRSRYVGG
jgi:predicted GH43/DUF377 family glycosyl hydrolase